MDSEWQQNLEEAIDATMTRVKLECFMRKCRRILSILVDL